MWFIITAICTSITVAVYLAAEKEKETVGKAWLLVFSVLFFILTVYLAEKSINDGGHHKDLNSIEVLYEY